MTLYRRLMGLDSPRISAHNLMAALAELARGRLVRADVDALLGLDSTEQAELTTLIGTFTGNALQKLARAIEVHDVLLLAGEQLSPYNTEAAVKTRLGV